MIKQTLAAALLIGSATPAMAYANFPTDALDLTEKMCSLESQGMTTQRAWNYLISSSLQRQPGFRYGTLGQIIATGFTHSMHMRAMRNKVSKLSHQVCPLYAFTIKGNAISAPRNPGSGSDNTTDPSAYIPK